MRWKRQGGSARGLCGILRISHPTARLRLSGGKSRRTVYERCVGAMSYRVVRPVSGGVKCLLHRNSFKPRRPLKALQLATRDCEFRLIAGPGSGKSFTIEDRVNWLLQNAANPQRVFAISFTNASAQDLRLRITQYCQSRGAGRRSRQHNNYALPGSAHVACSWVVAAVPVSPMVLDQWELENIFTAEFCSAHTMLFAEQIRFDATERRIGAQGFLTRPITFRPIPLFRTRSGKVYRAFSPASSKSIPVFCLAKLYGNV